jgi:hypothetical protein
MLSNRLAFAALGVGCLAAAAGGGYLASRQNAVPVPASAATTVTTPAAPAAPVTPTATPEAAVVAVQETEAVVGEATLRSAVPAAGATASRSGRDVTPGRQVAPTRSTDVPRGTRSTKPAQTARAAAPPLERTWPSGAAAQPAVPSPPPVPPAGASAPEAAAPRPVVEGERATQEPVRAPEPPQKMFEELVLPADSVIGLQTDTTISSERARVEDRVDARVTRDVRVNDRVVIPAGTRAIGTVILVEHGGKFKERARIGVRFNSLVLADGTRLPISTEKIIREGDAPNSAAKVGAGAVGGAILGAILGGGKGAAIGGMAGAGAGSAVVMAGDRNAATLPAGTPMTVRILSPVTVTLEK